MDSRVAFKAAFLAECVRDGLTLDQMRDRALEACALMEKSAIGTLNTIWEAGKDVGSAGLAALAALPLGVGAIGGYAAAKAKEDPGAVEDAKADELSSEYKRLASRLRRRRYYAEASRAGAEERFLGSQASRRRSYESAEADFKNRQSRLDALGAEHTRLSNRTDLPGDATGQVRAFGQELEGYRQSLTPPEPPVRLALPTPDADPLDELERRHQEMATSLGGGPGILGRATSAARSLLVPKPQKRVDVFA